MKKQSKPAFLFFETIGNHYKYERQLAQLKRFQSATWIHGMDAMHAINIWWMNRNLTFLARLKSIQLEYPWFFAGPTIGPWWIQRPLRVFLGASFFQVTLLWSLQMEVTWTFKKVTFINIFQRVTPGARTWKTCFFPYAKKGAFFGALVRLHLFPTIRFWWVIVAMIPTRDGHLTRGGWTLDVWHGYGGWKTHGRAMSTFQKRGPQRNMICIGYTDSQKDQNSVSNFK